MMPNLSHTQACFVAPGSTVIFRKGRPEADRLGTVAERLANGTYLVRLSDHRTLAATTEDFIVENERRPSGVARRR